MSSLFSALTAAVSGVSAQSESLGNISDNIANANTVGFKSIDTAFSSLVTASNSTTNNPGGVQAKPQYNNAVQGNIVSSSTATSLAISGQGYFAVETAVNNTSGTSSFTGSTYYTREGDFTLNQDGYLVNGSNYYLLGYSVDPSTNLVNTSSSSPIQISSLVNNPVATSSATYDANLPAGVSSGYTSTPSEVQVYDTLGNTHQMSFTWVNTGTDTWNLDVTVAGGNGTTTSNGVTTAVDYSATIPFTFNSGTNAGTPQAIGADTVAGATGTYTVPVNASQSVNSAQVDLPLTFGGASGQTLTLNFGAYNTASGLTQYSDSSVSVTSFSQNGLASGSYSSLSIDSSGIVAVNYTNGAVRDIAQIPIVQFYAPDQLQSASGNAFQATLASGSPRYNLAGTSGAGTIASSSLESSSVDIATQFTDMIQAQQVYSANAKVITAVNQMLTTIVNTIQ